MPTGPLFVADGATSLQAPRTGRMSEAIVGQCHGKYYEASSRGRMYQAQTAATGVAPGTALSTTAAFCLYNARASSYRFAIAKLGLGYISGTIGAGTIHIIGLGSTTAVPSGTAITARNLSLGMSNSSVSTALTTATVSTQAAGQIGILCATDAFTAASSSNGFNPVEKDVDGMIVVDAGCAMCLHGTTAAGSSPLVVFDATWEEILVG
jgi:hypothetical protein